MTENQAFSNKVKPNQARVADGSKFVGAVFLYTFIALAITAVVCGLCSFLLHKAVFSSTASDEALNTFIIILLVSLVLYIPVLIWSRIAIARNGKTMGAAYMFYSIIMGVLLSTFTAFIDFYTVAVSFGLTCLAFGGMSLIAWCSKRNLSNLALIGSGLLMGAMIIWLFYWIFSLITLSAFADMYINMIISYAVFAAIILITIVDLNNVKRIAMNGGAENNVALMCALNLYVDFIYIFIRIIAIVARFRRN